MSATAFARAEILRRVDKLQTELKSALSKTGPDAVHDVRVANRRLRQALRVIGFILARKESRRLRDELKPLMRSGGAARDCDVAMELLGEAGIPGQHPLWDELRAERAAAEAQFRRRIAAVLRKAGRNPWATRLHLKSDDERKPGARLPRVDPLLADYFAAGRAAARPGAKPAQLHAFRLETKHLRYTLELFHPLYGPAINARLEDLRGIQETLGQVNDATVAAARLQARSRRDPALQAALAFLLKRSQKLQSDFRAYWRHRLGPPEIEARWTHYLRRRKLP